MATNHNDESVPTIESAERDELNLKKKEDDDMITAGAGSAAENRSPTKQQSLPSDNTTAACGDNNAEDGNNSKVVMDASEMAEDKAVSTTANNHGEELPVVDPMALLNDGKRNLACDEIPQAVEALAEACRLLAEKHGDEAEELAETYFYYGKALLELARMENGVLGNALDGVTPEEENEADLSESEQFEKASQAKEEERAEVRDQVYEAMSEQENEKSNVDGKKESETNSSEEGTGNSLKLSAELSSDEAKDTDVEKNEITETGNVESSEVEQTEMEEKMDDDESEVKEFSAEDTGDEGISQDEGENEGDDVPNLQLAWEVLELSKKIYQKTDDKASKLKVADIFFTLGEVGIESEQYDSAIQDITSCLTIQTEVLGSDSDDRILAATHHQLGLTHLLNKAYTEAVNEMKLAKAVLDDRICNLEKTVSQENVDNKTKLEKELDELKQLLPEIEAKIEDAEDEARNAERTTQEMKAALTPQTTIGFGDTSSDNAAAATTIPTKKANDITNLVRKRKPEEETVTAEEPKKAKSETIEIETVASDKENGHAASNGHAAKCAIPQVEGQ